MIDIELFDVELHIDGYIIPLKLQATGKLVLYTRNGSKEFDNLLEVIQVWRDTN